MLVAIASDDGVHVAQDPGRCGGFVVFEIGVSTAVRVGYRSNACAAGRKQQDADMYESLIAELSDCGALIAHDLDTGLTRALRGNAIVAHAFPGESVDQAAQLFLSGGSKRNPPNPGAEAGEHGWVAAARDAVRKGRS